MRILERDIQGAVIRYAREQGCVCIKLSTNARYGTSGWPDYMLLYRGDVTFIEFKAPGAKLSPLQAKKFDELIEAGFEVDVVNEKAYGYAIVDAFTRPR